MNLTYCQNNKFFPNQAHNVLEQVQLISILALSSQMILESSDIWETTKSFRKVYQKKNLRALERKA